MPSLDDLADALELDGAALRRLEDRHGIRTPSELELGCRTNVLRDDEALGLELQKRLLGRLVRGSGWGDVRLLDAARRTAFRMVERLGRSNEVIRVTVRGSVKAMEPVHEQVSLAVLAHDPARLLDEVEALPLVVERRARDAASATIRIDEGSVVHVEVVDEIPWDNEDDGLVRMDDVQGVVGLHTDRGRGAFAPGWMLDRAAREGYAWTALAEGPFEDEGAEIEQVDVNVATMRDATTEKVLERLDDPAVDALAFPFDAVVLGRGEADVDRDRILDACAARGVAVAWSGLPHRLTLDLDWHRAARQRSLPGIPLADAHDLDGIDQAIYAVGQARRGGWHKDEILTTLDADVFRAWRDERRKGA